MRIEKLQTYAENEGIDVIIATSFENVCYLSGVPIHTQYLIPQRMAALIVPISNGEPTFVVCTIEQTLAQQESNIKNILGYQEFKDSPIKVIVDVLNSFHLEHGCIGVEMETLTAMQQVELKQLLPGAIFTSADGIFSRMRMIKDAEEIRLLSEITMVTDQAIRYAYETARTGVNERDVLHTLTSVLIQNGAETLPFLNLGAGKNALHTHPNAGNYQLATGDLLNCDVGGRWQGYFSDLARTAVIGKRTLQQEKAYDVVWEAQEKVIEAMRPGVLASDLFWLCSRTFEQRGMKLSLSHVGHSLGLGLHERPMLSPAETIALEAGMVLAVEPATRDETGKYHTEDLILITKDGSKVLSRSADWSKLLIIP
jgi:Xaa-Pro dipeptidase